MRTRFHNSARNGLTLLELVLVLVILTALGAIIIPMTEGVGEESRQTVTRSVLRDVSEILGNRYHSDMDNLLINDTFSPPIVLPGLPFPDPLHVAVHERNLTHPQLTFLFINPQRFGDANPATLDTDPTYNAVTRRGWNGPYLKHTGGRFLPSELHPSFTPIDFPNRYAGEGDPMILDGWGRPLVLQVPTGAFETLTEPELRIAWRHARLVSAGPNGILETPPDVLMPALDVRGDDFVLFLSVPDTALPTN